MVFQFIRNKLLTLEGYKTKIRHFKHIDIGKTVTLGHAAL